MPETARYTALIEGNHRMAAADMAKVLKEDIPFEEPTSKLPGFLLKILKWYALHLLCTAATSNWFLLDSAFYGAQPSQKDVFPAIGMVRKASRMNAIEKVFNFSKSMFIVALFATVHGLSGETEVPCSTEQILSWFLLAVNRSPRRFKACS
ncbi:hypothetical protein F0562_031473 [Nyssa sinensis]|uniref:Uncharacterized protein n=1 Tax=Nyssa sinensis TaxID=561372 RepID=A0A5J5AVR4_9ASTE|nr:hypothetical protein F0562_031473 [Nyssa sinensis]